MGLLNQKINGIVYDFSCITLTVNNIELKGIQSLTYTPSVDHQYVHGAGQLPLGVTPGQFTGTGSMEMILDDFRQLYLSFDVLTQTYFSISAIYHYAGMDSITEDLPKCIINSFGSNNAVGSAPLTRTVEFMLLEPAKIMKKSCATADADLLGKAFRAANIVGSIGGIAGF